MRGVSERLSVVVMTSTHKCVNTVSSLFVAKVSQCSPRKQHVKRSVRFRHANQSSCLFKFYSNRTSHRKFPLSPYESCQLYTVLLEIFGCQLWIYQMFVTFACVHCVCLWLRGSENIFNTTKCGWDIKHEVYFPPVGVIKRPAETQKMFFSSSELAEMCLQTLVSCGNDQVKKKKKIASQPSPGVSSLPWMKSR